MDARGELEREKHRYIAIRLHSAMRPCNSNCALTSGAVRPNDGGALDW